MVIKKKKKPESEAAFIYNAVLRRQVYVEGLKFEYSNNFNVTRDAILTIVAAALAKGELSRNNKAAFLLFLARVRREVLTVTAKWRNSFAADLQKFQAIDVKLAHEIYGHSGGSLASEDTKAGNSQLWATTNNAFVPAAGITFSAMLSGFVNATVGKIVQTLTTAYVDSQTNANAIVLLRDTVNKITLGAKGVIGTSFQHVGSQAQDEVASQTFGQYIWLSVMDSHTTEICQSRNLKIYTYGRGPVPPAHYGCRSTTAPWVDGVEPQKQTYYHWIKSQPDEVQNDILGAKQARDLRSGELNSNDFAKFEGATPITIDEYQSKFNFILHDNEG